MELRVNGSVIASPSSFAVTTLDLDDEGTTVRTMDGMLHRDRIAVKRQIEMAWGVLTRQQVSDVLQSMSGTFFEFTYPDPMEGAYITKTFYVGNRPTPAAVSKDGEIWWSGLKATLTER